MRNIFFTSILATTLFLGGVQSALADEVQPFAPIDTYQLGDLNGQDGWSDFWNSLIVEEGVVASSTQAISSHRLFGGIAFKQIPLDQYDHGGARVKFEIDQNDFSDDQAIFGLFKNNTQETIASLRFVHNFNTFINTITATESGIQNPVVLGTLTQGEWHTISLEWRRADLSLRARLDEDPWTDWFVAQAGWEADDSVGITLSLPDAKTYGKMYLADLELYTPLPDVVEENPVVEQVAEKLSDVVSAIIETLSTTSAQVLSFEDLIASTSASTTPDNADTLSSSSEESGEQNSDTTTPESPLPLEQSPSTDEVATTSEVSQAPEQSSVDEVAPTATPEQDIVTAPLEASDTSTTTATF